jgi:hypothetical protein
LFGGNYSSGIKLETLFKLSKECAEEGERERTIALL